MGLLTTRFFSYLDHNCITTTVYEIFKLFPNHKNIELQQFYT